MARDWAELGETVSVIRAQLQQALDEGADKALRFRTGPVELEFSLAVHKEGEARAKVFVVPWSAEARATAGADSVQRIKLTLQPIKSDGTDARISGRADQRPS
ncbi:trypco2 family protein [Streptomyces sp. NPDC002156]